MIFDPVLDLFRGEAITIPPMDGAFRPNTLLDDAATLARIEAPDDLVEDAEGRLVAASANSVVAVGHDGRLEPLSSFDVRVSALACSREGRLAVGLEDGALLVDGERQKLPAAVNCITAIGFAGDGMLWLANGSARHAPAAWAADLMEKGRSGSVWRGRPGGTFERVVDGLAFPFAMLAAGDSMLVSESWRHRLVEISGSGRTAIRLDHLPGYPARLSRARDGGAWLSLFAPRNRLVEFVLLEDDYRHDMMAEVAPEHWIAPALGSRRSFLEPLQCGGIKTMGVHKPWSPSRSYGLVVRLDAALRPLFSLHSRADGNRHGICSAVEHGDRLVAASRGGGCLISLDADGGQ